MGQPKSPKCLGNKNNENAPEKRERKKEKTGKTENFLMGWNKEKRKSIPKKHEKHKAFKAFKTKTQELRHPRPAGTKDWKMRMGLPRHRNSRTASTVQPGQVWSLRGPCIGPETTLIGPGEKLRFV